MTKTQFCLMISLAMILANLGQEARSEQSNLQSIEISRTESQNPAVGCACSRMPTSNLSEDQLFKLRDKWLNDDQIGDLAANRFGCDCAGCRTAIGIAQMNLE
jgi:hypothetical protein